MMEILLDLVTNDNLVIVAGLGIIWGLVISLLAYRHLHDSADETAHLLSSFRNLRRRFGTRGAKLAWWGGVLFYAGIFINAAQYVWTHYLPLR